MAHRLIIGMVVLALSASAALAQPAAAPPAGPPATFAVDENAPVLLKGQVVWVDWERPRVQIHLVLESGDRWLVEAGSRNTMLRGGFTADSLKPGVAIIVRGYQSKDKACTPECRAQGRDINVIGSSKTYFQEPGSRPAP